MQVIHTHGKRLMSTSSVSHYPIVNLIPPPLLLALTPSFTLLPTLEENGDIGNGSFIQCCNISALRLVYFRNEITTAGF